jgi:hypothetical protein
MCCNILKFIILGAEPTSAAGISVTTEATMTESTTTVTVKPKLRKKPKPVTKKAPKKAKKPTVKELQTSLDKFKSQNCKRTKSRAILSYSFFTELIQGKFKS